MTPFIILAPTSAVGLSNFTLAPPSSLHPPPSSSFLCSTPLADYAVEEKPSEIVLMQQLEEENPDPLVFVLNANLLAMVKLVNCEYFYVWI